MADRIVIHRGTYHDSAFLMRVARQLQRVDGVAEAVVLMGTPMNAELVRGAGFGGPELEEVTPTDMIVALRGSQHALDAALAEADRLLEGGREGEAATARRRPASLGEALQRHPATNVVSIAVPGEYAAHVAHDALDSGRHVFLFSDNVSVEDEVALKQRGKELGLLVMGPDCGTSILAGTRLGFANRVPRGNVGLVGPSGTGIQEVSCVLARRGAGISHAIGTGGRDLSDRVGGAMTLFALDLLRTDESTDIVVLVAKSPADATAAEVHRKMLRLGKPCVVRYLGQEPRGDEGDVRYVSTLDEAAVIAAALASGDPSVVPAAGGLDGALDAPDQRVDGTLLGLFGGGSLTSEALTVLRRHGLDARTLDRVLEPADLGEGAAHLVLDVGDDAYTRGRPHPMVDPTARVAMIEAALAHPEVGMLLLDVMLGDGAHPDPGTEIARAVSAARQARRTGVPAVVCSVSGTAEDPQDLARQVEVLEAAGIHVEPTGARAATWAALAMGGDPGRSR